MPEPTEDLTIEAVTTVEPDALNETQKGFLEEHKDELSDEQAEKYGITKEIKPESIKPEVRGTGAEPPAKPPKKEEGEDEEEVLPEDKKVISKVVSEAISPLQKKVQEQEYQVEVDNFIRNSANEYPNLAKYRDAILIHMKAHPTVVARDAFFIVAGKGLMKLGAQKEREAQAAANATKGGGSTIRVTPGEKDWSTASKEEFEAKKAEVFSRH